MREAAARVDFDYAPDDPPPRRPRPRHAEPTIAPAPRLPARGQSAGHGHPGALRAMVRRPMLSLAIISGAALAVGFFANALFMQSGPHPAPLFAAKDAPRTDPAPAQRPGQSGAPSAAPRSAPPAVAPTATASTPAASLPAGPVPSGVAPAAPPPPQRAQSAPPAQSARAPAPEEKFDPITQFLRSGSAPPASPLAPTTTGSAGAAAADSGPRRVMAAQRALAKLGHKVEADGLSGPSTRAAIQSFEREARLPVTGELNPRTLKELASRSGLQIP